jgi:hypothetical protein
MEPTNIEVLDYATESRPTRLWSLPSTSDDLLPSIQQPKSFATRCITLRTSYKSFITKTRSTFYGVLVLTIYCVKSHVCEA